MHRRSLFTTLSLPLPAQIAACSVHHVPWLSVLFQNLLSNRSAEKRCKRPVALQHPLFHTHACPTLNASAQFDVSEPARSLKRSHSDAQMTGCQVSKHPKLSPGQASLNHTVPAAAMVPLVSVMLTSLAPVLVVRCSSRQMFTELLLCESIVS